MMKNTINAFVTGNTGFVGDEISKHFKNNGIDVIGYDLKNNQDILDIAQLSSAMHNCNVVIHLAAIENEPSIDTLRTNLLGTYNVLQAMQVNQIRKIIFMSSVDTLGIFQGEGDPKYLPLDDKYPCHPVRHYSISKKLAEELCMTFSQSKKIASLCIRAPGIWNQNTYRYISHKRKENPEYEWSPYWEYGAFIDIRDLSNAILEACKVDFDGFYCYAIASDDITTSGMTSLELVNKLYPSIDWRGGKEYGTNPYKSLIDCTNIKKLLNWKPKYSWKQYMKEEIV